jgi:D-3-phosphoglycerate dehydrogenase / 2-oxoglutarate reductase
MMNKILITAKVHPYLIDHFEEKGYKVLYHPAITYDEVYSQVHGCEGLVVTTRIPIDKNIIDNAVHLQWIARLGSGMELIDVDYAEAKGIRCISSPEGNANAVGEHALGMLLCLYNNILKSNLELRQGIWEREKNRGNEVEGKVVGIIGYGHTGQAFAEKLRGFDTEILAYDKYKSGFETEYVKEVQMPEIFKRADIVSLHVPLTSETYHMADRNFFDSFLGSVFIINTSRGPVVKIADLITNIQSGKVQGACLDVLENEKLDKMTEEEKHQFNFLLHHPRVLLTPHIAGYTHEASLKMAETIFRKLGV